MNQPQIASTLSGAKTATVGFLTAHPISVAVIGGALVGVGAYYATKAVVARCNKKDESTEEAVAAAA